MTRYISNGKKNDDIVFRVNKNGTPTDVLRISGSVGGIQFKSGVASLTNSGYTIADTDGYGSALVSTGSSDRTITLPSASTNSGRIINFKKTDGGSGKLIIGGTVDGLSNPYITSQNGNCSIQSDGSSWWFVKLINEYSGYTPSISSSTNTSGPTVSAASFQRSGNFVHITMHGSVTVSTPALSQFLVSVPIGSNFSNSLQATGNVGFAATNGTGAGWVESVASSTNVACRFYATNNNTGEWGVSFIYSIQ